MSLLMAFLKLCSVFVLLFVFLYVSAVVFTYVAFMYASAVFILLGTALAYIISYILSSFFKGE